MHDTKGGLAPTGSMVPGIACHNGETMGQSAVVEDSLQYKNYGRFYQTTVTKSNAIGHAHYTIQHLHAYQVRVWQYVGTMWAQ